MEPPFASFFEEIKTLTSFCDDLHQTSENVDKISAKVNFKEWFTHH